MKLIAKTQIGKEFFHSREHAYFAPNASANKIAKALNDSKYQLKDDEIWWVYDYDISDDMYVYRRFTIRKGVIKAVYL